MASREPCGDVDAAQAVAACTAWDRYGKGRVPAALNYGDLFSYALAATLVIAYDHPDHADTTTARVVTLWRRR